MGYGNGLGNLQQLFSTTDVDATGKSAATAKTGQSSASSFGVNSWTGAVSGDQTQLSTAPAKNQAISVWDTLTR